MRLAAALGTLLVAGCGASAPLVTVDQLVAQCDAFKGKPVNLAGYLGTCAGYDCHLFADKAGLDAAAAAWADERTATRLLNRGDESQKAKAVEAMDRIFAIPTIGIGGGEIFDRKAAPLQNSYVVIAGRVAKDTCTGIGGTDRSAGIEPTDIRAWTPAKDAPANTH